MDAGYGDIDTGSILGHAHPDHGVVVGDCLVQVDVAQGRDDLPGGEGDGPGGHLDVGQVEGAGGPGTEVILNIVVIRELVTNKEL